LSNTDARDIEKEHACLRVQVHLAGRHGLRELMAPTTEYRAYHDAISGDPLAHACDGAAALARDAIDRASSRPWIDVLERALAETRARLDACASEEGTPHVAIALHPVGFAFGENHETCGTCAWSYRGGRGPPVERCRQSAGSDGNGRRTEGRFRACVRWEPPVACQTCGACCREAYHSVTVSVRDPVVWKQPDLIVRNGHRFEIRRAGDRCAGLEETRADGSSERAGLRGLTQKSPATSRASAGPVFSCAIYDDRPRACRDFEAGGAHCLVARRRVGLSP
jgi:Fe-S-cluster containining protein